MTPTFLTPRFNLASPSIHLSHIAASSPFLASSSSCLLLETCCSATLSLPRLTFGTLSSLSSSSLASTLEGCNLAVDNAAPGIWPRPTPLHFVRPHLSLKYQRETSGTDPPNSKYEDRYSGGKGIKFFLRNKSLDLNLIYTQIYLFIYFNSCIYPWGINTWKELREFILEGWFKNISWIVITWTFCQT